MEISSKASPSKKLTNHFDGDVICQNDQGKELPLNVPQIIDSKQKDNDAVQETNIVKPWKQQNGILLKSNGKNNPGRYSFELDWYLIDGI